MCTTSPLSLCTKKNNNRLFYSSNGQHVFCFCTFDHPATLIVKKNAQQERMYSKIHIIHHFRVVLLFTRFCRGS